MRFDELRVKISSLAAEGRIIRRRASKAQMAYRKANRAIRVVQNEIALSLSTSKDAHDALLQKITVHRDDAETSFWSLRKHNVGVGQEARSAQLAFAFLRGRPYSSCEQANTVNPPDWLRVFEIAKKFAPARYFDPLDFQVWVEDGIDHLSTGQKEGHASTRLDIPTIKKSTKAELEKVRAQPLRERLGRETVRSL